MKKILYIIDKPNLYGSELHVLKLMNLLKDDYEISLCAFDEGPLLELLTPYFKIHVFKLKWYPSMKIIAFYRFLKNNKFNVLHAHQPKALFWTSIIGKMLNKFVVITLHSLPQTNKDTHKGYLKHFVFLFHTFVKLVSEFFAQKVVCLSNHTIEHVLFKKKVIEIPNWVNTEVRNHPKTIAKKPFKLISVGSVTENKGFDRLIDSLVYIKDEEWSLDIYGDYEEEFFNILNQKIILHNLENRIFFKGYDMKAQKYLERYDFFILLSKSETFGMVYIEAMSQGLPLIVWDLPVLKYVVPNENLIMTKNSDLRRMFMESYLKNYKNISSINIKTVKDKFTEDKVYIKYKDLYD